MPDPFGQLLRRMRTDAGLSLRAFAARAGIDYSYIGQIERGDRRCSQQWAEICDATLNAGGELLEAYRADVGQNRTRRRGGADVDQEDLLRRRTLLYHAVTAVAAGSLPALDQIRQGLASSVTGQDPTDLDVDEWAEVAAEYGRAFLTEKPDVVFTNLAGDIADLDLSLSHATERSAGALSTVAAQLSAIMAMTLVNLGQYQPARRWWRVARRAAAQSPDPTVRVWIHGQDAMHVLYDRRPLHAAVDGAARAEALASGAASSGVAEAIAARAQTMAKLGRAADARAALATLTDTFDRLPDGVADDQASMYGWPEQRLWHTASYVLTELGDTREAYEAQTRALALIPDTLPRRRAKVQMHLARCLVTDGHFDDGTGYAQQVIDALPTHDRTALVIGLGRRVLDQVPAGEHTRSAVRGLREMLALPAGPATA